ncbi:carboxymuconolactone decarboxylase family protein [Pedobacter panaciterrae]|uniref:carboxymuconolactone decarboxylase family protein n=1 Tax=Pedobacter panaciterrae TaxID=363849 RepID=UPI003F6921B6
MKTVNVPKREEVSPGSQQMFDQIQSSLGKVPNLYATIGYSESALRGFLAFDSAMATSVFSPKEKEAIALVVSQANSCDYCLAAHTMLARKNGFEKQDILEIRKGKISDPKINALLELARTITVDKGQFGDEALDAFFQVGYDHAALIELIALIALRVFTNYVYAATNIPIDFPLAEPLG